VMMKSRGRSAKIDHHLPDQNIIIALLGNEITLDIKKVMSNFTNMQLYMYIYT